jgi:hypothetical protein
MLWLNWSKAKQLPQEIKQQFVNQQQGSYFEGK